MGEVTFWKKSATEEYGRNMTASDVWNADIRDFNRPGTYRLVIDGVGCSRDFRISGDIYHEPFKTSVRGYYYMRIGEDRMDMVPVPRRPLFIPGQDPNGFTVYLTDLHPFDPAWKTVGVQREAVAGKPGLRGGRGTVVCVYRPAPR